MELYDDDKLKKMLKQYSSKKKTKGGGF